MVMLGDKFKSPISYVLQGNKGGRSPFFGDMCVVFRGDVFRQRPPSQTTDADFIITFDINLEIFWRSALVQDFR
jgi:hypothetical protein